MIFIGFLVRPTEKFWEHLPTLGFSIDLGQAEALRGALGMVWGFGGGGLWFPHCSLASGLIYTGTHHRPGALSNPQHRSTPSRPPTPRTRGVVHWWPPPLPPLKILHVQASASRTRLCCRWGRSGRNTDLPALLSGGRWPITQGGSSGKVASPRIAATIRARGERKHRNPSPGEAVV